MAVAQSLTLTPPRPAPPVVLRQLPAGLRWLRARWAYHTAFWTALYLFNTAYTGHLTQDYTYAFYDYSVRLPFYMAACYLNLYYLLPRLLPQKRYLTYAGLLLGAVLGLTLLMHLTLSRLFDARLCPPALCTPEYATNLLFSPLHTAQHMFRVLTLIGLATGLKLGKDWVRQQQALREVERLNLQNELDFLKSQIQPHFFFNTLNNLYSLTLKKSDQAPEVVLKLADLMSYMLYDADAPAVALTKEVECLHNYLALEGLRYGARLQLRVDVRGELHGKQVVPLLLLPFIENSFKHGVAATPAPVVIAVSLDVAADAIRLVVENPKCVPPSARPGGLGLKNVQRRLALLYPERHCLTIEDTATTYRVELHVPLA